MSGVPPRRAHWLRRNEAARYPRRIVCFDSEAAKRQEGRRELHRFRLAVASFDVIDRATRESRRTERSRFDDPAALWQWIDARTSSKERLAVFAHNLGYDLRITRALEELPALGWQLQSFSLDSYRCWLRWRRGERTLLLVDSMSFVGRGLAEVASKLGVRRPELPGDDSADGEWWTRCERDVDVLRAVVLRLLRWLEESDAGNFRMTGPAQGTAMFRHRFLPERTLLVHDDADALAAERRAAWAGRCEVYRHGRVTGPLTEWDYRNAYAVIARDAELPVRLRGVIRRPSLRNVLEAPRSVAVLADVRVTTEAPVVPCAVDGRIAWPVGSFTTTLWDLEARMAVEAGATVEPLRAWTYHRAPLLRPWATWILGRLDERTGEDDPVARLVLKQWSRSVVGRFGLRYPRWESVGTAEDVDLALMPFTDGDDGSRGVYLRLGRQVLEQSGEEESPDSAPAIMSYIMALARRRLWDAMGQLPPDALVYVDTDSLLVRASADEAVAAVAAQPLHEGLRVKATYHRGTFYAPRQYEVDRQPRVAGVPRRARKVAPRTFEAEVWEGTPESIRRGRPGEVAVSTRRMTVRQPDRRRLHLPGGATAPVSYIEERGDGER